MISRSVLYDAKAFLCWDVFDNLSVQLVPLETSAAFYYPPNNEAHSIVLFYEIDQPDFSESLFLLFHEAGHAQQCQKLDDREVSARKLQMPNGPERAAFEQLAWAEARTLFIQFLEKQQIKVDDLLSAFTEFSNFCIESYKVQEK